MGLVVWIDELFDETAQVKKHFERNDNDEEKRNY